jgi:hypothetical protein
LLLLGVPTSIGLVQAILSKVKLSTEVEDIDLSRQMVACNMISSGSVDLSHWTTTDKNMRQHTTKPMAKPKRLGMGHPLMQVSPQQA